MACLYFSQTMIRCTSLSHFVTYIENKLLLDINTSGASVCWAWKVLEKLFCSQQQGLRFLKTFSTQSSLHHPQNSPWVTKQVGKGGEGSRLHSSLNNGPDTSIKSGGCNFQLQCMAWSYEKTKPKQTFWLKQELELSKFPLVGLPIRVNDLRDWNHRFKEVFWIML